MISYDDLKYKLTHGGLKVTPQRIAVLDSVQSLNHPSADSILAYTRQHNPGISTGTAGRKISKTITIIYKYKQ